MVSMKSYIKPHIWIWLKCSRSAASIPSHLFTDPRNNLMNAAPCWDLTNGSSSDGQLRRLARHPCLWTDPEQAIEDNRLPPVLMPPTIIVIPIGITIVTYRLIVFFGLENSNDFQRFYEDLNTMPLSIPLLDAQRFDAALSLRDLRNAFDEGSVFWKMRQCRKCGIMERYMKRCEKCTKHYCCVLCQKEDWPDHKKECKKIREELKKWPTPRDGRKAVYMSLPLCPQRFWCSDEQALKLLRRVTGTCWKFGANGKVCREGSGQHSS